MPSSATLAAIGIRISAIDNTTDALSQIARQMKGLTKATPDKGGLFTRMGLTRANLGVVRKGVNDVHGAAASAISTVGKFIPAIGAVAAGGIIAGIAGVAESFTSFAATTGRTAASLGIPVQQFYNLQKSGELAGLSTDQVTQSLSGLQDTLADAAFGRNDAAANMFKQVHIDFGGTARGVADVTKTLPQVANVVEGFAKSGHEHAALHFLDTIGMGREMFSWLKFGTEGLDAYNAEAAKSPPLTLAETIVAADLQREQNKLTEQFRGMGFDLMQALAPALEHVTEDITRFVANHPGEIKTFFDTIGKGAIWVVTEVDNLLGVTTSASRNWLVRKLFGYDETTEAPLLSAAPATSPGMPAARAPATNADLTYDPGEGASGSPRRVIRAMDDRNESDSGPAGGAAGGAGVYSGADASQGGGQLRSMRNNNPTNLTFVGQEGATNQAGMAKFSNMETGVAADLNQLLIDQDRHHLRTIEEIIHRATPADENPGVEGYIDKVAKDLGIKRTDAVNFRDAAFAEKYIQAVARQEGGAPDQAAVRRGVNMRLGVADPATQLAANGAPGAVAAPAGPPAQAPPPSASGGALGSLMDRLRVEVNHTNAPPGATVTVTADHPGLQVASVIRTPAAVT